MCDFFEDVLEGTFEEMASQLVHKAKSDPEWITSLLLTLSKKLKERTDLQRINDDYLSPNSFSRFFKPIRKLLDMNDVPVAWKRICYTFPQRDNTYYDSRGYTREKIQKMLGFCQNLKVIISNWMNVNKIYRRSNFIDIVQTKLI